MLSRFSLLRVSLRGACVPRIPCDVCPFANHPLPFLHCVSATPTPTPVVPQGWRQEAGRLWARVPHPYPLTLFVAAVVTRYWGITFPDSIVFDEVHFGGFVRDYDSGRWGIHVGACVFVCLCVCLCPCACACACVCMLPLTRVGAPPCDVCLHPRPPTLALLTGTSSTSTPHWASCPFCGWESCWATIPTTATTGVMT
jgi:hypothetical protein